MSSQLPLLMAACSISICACSQYPHADSVRILRLNAAGAASDAKSIEPTPQPIPRRHFTVNINENLLQTHGEKRIEINLSTQRGVYLINGKTALEFPVCTGAKGYETPPGTYRILEKKRHHVSNLYHVAMPCFMRLTYDGIGLHVGKIYRQPASHGCIRLPREACLPIFNTIPIGTMVTIF